MDMKIGISVNHILYIHLLFTELVAKKINKYNRLVKLNKKT